MVVSTMSLLHVLPAFNFGVKVVATFENVYMRLLGICFASFSSGIGDQLFLPIPHLICFNIGLGELTFLQLSTTFRHPSVAGRSVGCGLT